MNKNDYEYWTETYNQDKISKATRPRKQQISSQDLHCRCLSCVYDNYKHALHKFSLF